MSGVAEEFAARMDELAPSSRVVVAVSGGLDSMALLALMSCFTRQRGGALVVAHFNHHLRGHESDDDEEFVRQAAAGMGWLCRVGGGDVRAAARGISIEMAARDLRHRFLAEVAREAGGDLFLAHHADDQIELHLMRTRRGVRGPGLGGMQMDSRSPVDRNVRLLRPLLGVSRGRLADFVRQNQVQYREDSSNAEAGNERNRIRMDVIPRLRDQIGGGFDGAILRSVAEEQQRCALARAAAKKWLTESGDFAALTAPMQEEILAAQLEANAIPVTKRRLAALLSRPGALFEVGGGRRISRDRLGRLKVFREEWSGAEQKIAIETSGETLFEGLRIQWSFPGGADLTGKGNVMFFDADKVGAGAKLRHWRKGDRIQLSGRASVRPLHEMFSRNKIEREMRHQAIVAETGGGEIFWVEGLRVTERFKVTGQTRRHMEWRWERE